MGSETVGFVDRLGYLYCLPCWLIVGTARQVRCRGISATGPCRYGSPQRRVVRALRAPAQSQEEGQAVTDERDARDTAIARVTMASADWQPFARLALQTIACEREEFTTDDVWRLLHERGIPDPPEHRSMSGATGYGGIA